MVKTYQSCCPRCNKTHEACSDAKTCTKWRISYEVCIVFGTRPHRPGFKGAGIIRR